jgi:hypothetical protein
MVRKRRKRRNEVHWHRRGEDKNPTTNEDPNEQIPPHALMHEQALPIEALSGSHRSPKGM